MHETLGAAPREELEWLAAGALYLARYVREVHIVIRRESLRDTTSQYLIEQLDKTPNFRLRPHTELERVEGTGHVERVGSCSPDGN